MAFHDFIADTDECELAKENYQLGKQQISYFSNTHKLARFIESKIGIILKKENLDSFDSFERNTNKL